MMGYKLKIIMKDGTEIVGPFVAPNSNKSEFGYNDRKIKREIEKTAKGISRQKDVEKAECIEEEYL